MSIASESVTRVGPRSARSMLMREAGRLEPVDVSLPVIGPDDGLLRVQLAGICGTDHSILDGSFGGRMQLPLVPGHEIVGVIEEIGPVAAQRWGVEVGDRVAVDSFLACGACSACLLGDTRYCLELGDYGISMSYDRAPHLFGGFSEYVYLAPQAQVYPLPESFSAEMGLLVTAVVSNALRWVCHAGGVGPGSSVLISGPGPIGLAAVAVARAAGAAIVAVSGLERDAHRLDFAHRLGADVVRVVGRDPDSGLLEATAGQGFDAAVDVSGSVESVSSSVSLVRRCGTVVIAGLAGAGARAQFPIDEVALREITLRGQFSHDRVSLLRAIAFVDSVHVPWDEFVTHRYSLAETATAIQSAASEPGFVKAVIDPTM